MKPQIRYVVDENGHTRDAIVPISLWKQFLLNKKKRSKKFTTSDLEYFFGKIKISLDPLRFQKLIRNEWS